jgi:hypothetical protein
MKKVLFILGLPCIAFFSKAQTEKTRTYLWGNGGGNYASLYETSKTTEGIKGIIGPELGISVRMQNRAQLGLETGVYYSMKGVKFIDSDTKVTLNYIGVFANGLLFFPLANYDEVYAGGGFYIARALSGKSKSDTTSSTIRFGDTWKKLDAGIQLRGAYSIKNIVAIGLHYDIGVLRTFSSKDLRGASFYGRNSALTLFVSLKLVKLFGK